LLSLQAAAIATCYTVQKIEMFERLSEGRPKANFPGQN